MKSYFQHCYRRVFILCAQLIFMFRNVNSLRYVHTCDIFLLQVCYLDFECLYQNESRFSTQSIQTNGARNFVNLGQYSQILPLIKVQNYASVQFSSVAQSCSTLCDPMNHSTPGLPVHHHLPEFTQTHVHRVRDAIQPSHPLLSPFPPARNLSQHQSLFQ